MSTPVAFFRENQITEKDIAYQLYLQPENQKNPATAVLLYLLGKEMKTRAEQSFLKANESEIAASIEQIRAAGNLESLLSTLGYSEEELADEIRKQKLLDLWMESEHLIDENDLEKFYQDRFADLLVPAKYHIRHILLMFDPEKKGKDRDELSRSMDEIEANDRPFEEKAMLFSECVSAANGGDLGRVHSKDLYPEIGNLIETMKPGDPPQRVSTEIGIHLVEVLDVEPEKTFTEEEKRKTARARYLQLRNKTEIKMIMEKIRGEIRFEE